MGVFGLLGRGRHERAAFQLYATAVAAARDPLFYAELGVADTLDGRFDLVGLHVFLLIRRLRGIAAVGPALAQAVFDAMFRDMDLNLREMGVGDLSVGRKNRAMWEAFHGRSVAYQEALASGDVARLETALARNVWRGASAGSEPARLARIVLAQDADLCGQSDTALSAGRVTFRTASDILATPAVA
jgi:cytochrome b pre-mRNA-processing protein 3